MRTLNVTLLLVLSFCIAYTAMASKLYKKEPPAGTEIVYPRDGALMVWVPSGYFTMGMNKERAEKILKGFGYADGWEECWAWEWAPEHRVNVSGFFIDKYEVTWGQWRKYLAANPDVDTKSPPVPTEKIAGQYSLYPVTNILWADAMRFANWAGKQLPYEAQWEKAARGTDARTFPWGNAMPTADQGRFVDLVTGAGNKELTAIVGIHPKGNSPYGCCDMAGNVMEWTCEWFEPYSNNPYAGKMRSYTGHRNASVRGGAFYFGQIAYISAKRFGFTPEETYSNTGFRTVWTPPEDYFTSKAFKEAKANVPAYKAEYSRLKSIANPNSPAPPL